MQAIKNLTNQRPVLSILRNPRRLAPLHCLLAFLASGASLRAQTGGTASVTTLTASGSLGIYTLTASVAGGAPNAPTGTVTFINVTAGSTLGNITLSAPALGFVNSMFSTGQSPSAIVVQDFNGDGKPDLAITNLNDNSVTILLGNGDGTFSPAVNSPVSVGNSPSGIAGGDFNGDGKPDLAIANTVDGTVTILLGNGDGTFTASANSPIAVGSFPQSLAAADFDGDGKLDLAVANSADSTLTILLGNGDGTFTQTAASPIVVGSTPTHVAAADLNNDGKIDIVTVNQDDNTLTVLLGNGDGTFSTAANSPVIVGYAPSNLIIVDVNGDGKPDLVATNAADNTLTVLLGVGNGTFTPAPASPVLVGTNPQWVAAADFNGDGNQDLAVANSGDDTLSILFGVGNGTFTPAPSSPLPVGNSPLAIQVADFNGDHKPDMAIVNGDDNTVGILLSGQAASATLANVTLAGTTIQQVQAKYVGDSNSTNSLSNIIYLVPTGLTATTTTLTTSLNPSQAGQSVTFTATVTPASGTTVPTGTVTFMDGSTSLGTGTLSATGVATFTTSTLAAGSHSITAGYSGDTNFNPSTSSPPIMQVVSGIATATSLTSSLNPSQAGQSVTFTATVTRASGSGVPTGTVTFLEGGTPLGTGTLNSSGIATYATSTLAVGSQFITAGYGGDTNYAASTSPQITQVVNGTTTVTTISQISTSPFDGTLALPANMALVGGHITINFTVSPTTATGTVSVKDGFNDTCGATLASGAAGAGTCAMTISQAGSGSTTLIATYSPDVNATASGFLASTSNPVKENVAQIVQCGSALAKQTVVQGQTATIPFAVCLASDINVTPTATSTGCPSNTQCTVAIAAVQGQPGAYTVTLNVATTGAGTTATILDPRPRIWPWAFSLLGLNCFVWILMILWREQRRLRPARLICVAAALLLALGIANLSGCSSAGSTGSSNLDVTPLGDAVINVNVSAGNAAAVVPVNVDVTN